jgi:hypothetical protein
VRIESFSLLSAFAVFAIACSPPRGFVDDVAAVDAPVSDDTTMVDATDSDTAADAPVDRGTIPITDTGPVLDMTIVYAHSNTELFAVDPHTSPPAFSTVGMFSFPTGDANNHTMTDIAIDATGSIVGTTQDALYRIDEHTAACTFLAMLPSTTTQFVGLTFVPAGVLDPSNEVLLGGTADGAYYRISTTDGSATQLGQLQNSYQLSGDFVSIAGAATYATVRRSSTDTDALARIDLDTGRVNIIGDTTFHSLYGLAYWRSTFFGFSHSGELVIIDGMTGRGRLVSMPVPQFSGAGVTTIAPIAPG